jgi:N-acetylglucosaminyl-diphospho-decaprenol L-rhamnosyltransferase
VATGSDAVDACAMCSNRRVVAVVITTYSAPHEMLERCVRAVLAGGDVSAVIVVDNGGRAVLPADLVDHVELIRSERNGGFGAAANIGFRRAAELGATAVALLNDDVVVEAGWLGPLLACLDNGQRIGAVQPKLLLAGTDPPLVNSVGVRLDRYGAGQDIGYRRPDGPSFAGPTTIDLFTGGAVLFDPAFIAELGGFDERFFMYYEDVDLALRGHERGWTYRCQPASRVWHEGGASAGDGGLRRFVERNRVWCLFRFGSPRTVVAGLWLSVRRLRHAPRRLHAKALLGGLAVAPRRLRERLLAR